MHSIAPTGSLLECRLSQLTLARKFEAVHRKTVTRRQVRPKVLLATFKQLGFLGALDAALLRDMNDADRSSIGVSSSREPDGLRLVRSSSGSMPMGRNGSAEAMLLAVPVGAQAALGFFGGEQLGSSVPLGAV